jgi:hypothetical protein
MSDDIFIDTILEAQAIVARHLAGEHASAEETIAKLMQLLDSTELVKALAKRGFSSKASRVKLTSIKQADVRSSLPFVPAKAGSQSLALDSRHKRVYARLRRAMRGNERSLS